jgi:N-acetyl-anhydromuramyl-L-alanine amidase AmpD
MLNTMKLYSPNYYLGTDPIQAVVLHGTAGQLAGSLGWLLSPKSQVSSNYLVSKAGTIYELVPWELGRRAWANGIPETYDTSIKWLVDAIIKGKNLNLITVSIEHEATKSEMDNRASMTDKQFNSSIELTAYILKKAGLKANHQTIIGHNQISGKNKFNCPGVIFPPAYTEQLIIRHRELG